MRVLAGGAGACGTGRLVHGGPVDANPLKAWRRAATPAGRAAGGESRGRCGWCPWTDQPWRPVNRGGRRRSHREYGEDPQEAGAAAQSAAFAPVTAAKGPNENGGAYYAPTRSFSASNWAGR